MNGASFRRPARALISPADGVAIAGTSSTELPLQAGDVLCSPMTLVNSVLTGQSERVPSPAEVADFALSVARDGVDRIAGFIGPFHADDEDADAELILAEAASEQPSDDPAATRRESWERHAAISLLLGAKCAARVGLPDEDA